MADKRKSFFRERSVNEILEMDVRMAQSQRNLVGKILDLNEGEALQLMSPITPARFSAGGLDSREASRKCYKHGEIIALSQPLGEREAYERREIPLAIRTRDFNDKLSGKREEEINFVGYSWRPVKGRDDRKRIVPFIVPLMAAQIFAYAENSALGIDVEPYADSRRVKLDGASVVCRVPSRSEKHQRYKVVLEHVPVDNGTEKRAVVWSLKPKFEEGEPEHDTYAGIRYTWEKGREGSDVIRFGPHGVAAYIATIKHFKQRQVFTPIEMNPFILPSQLGVDFYKKLGNNLVVYDPALQGKVKFRKAHMDEKSILFGRLIGVKGANEVAYWDPERDGRLKDYDWKAK